MSNTPLFGFIFHCSFKLFLFDPIDLVHYSEEISIRDY